MKRTYLTRTLIALSIGMLFAFFVSCEDSGNEPGDGERGTIEMRITDAPFPIEFVSSAYVTINLVEIRHKDNNGESTFIRISEEEQSFNLLELRNGIDSVLARTVVDAGTYDQVRLYVTNASITLTNNMTYDLKIPSGMQSGLKLNISPAIEVSNAQTVEVLLDFDLSKSFVVQGNPDTPAGIKGFHFKPVVRCVNLGEAGRIYGTVKSSNDVMLENASVWATQDTVVTFTFTDFNGEYALAGIPSGTYSVHATAAGYDTISVSDVTVTDNHATEANFTLNMQ